MKVLYSYVNAGDVTHTIAVSYLLWVFNTLPPLSSLGSKEGKITSSLESLYVHIVSGNIKYNLCYMYIHHCLLSIKDCPHFCVH